MDDIAPYLERLGLEHYLDVFLGGGFNTWEALFDIQESDFDALNVKLGHRRKLQRAIADHRRVSYDRLVGSPGGGAFQTEPLVKNKRRYRRHPKHDHNAPNRPPSAYVVFSNEVREEIKDKNLSFTQIARLVGNRWHNLNPTSKELFEAQASTAKEIYNLELSAYLKTDMHEEYAHYLSEFKAKHEQPSEQKRPRLKPELVESLVSASSFEINSGIVSGYAHANSVDSLSSSPCVGASTQSNIRLSWTAGHLRPRSASAGSGSSLLHQRNHRPIRSGLISRHTSQSDESLTIRNDVLEPLVHTVVLSRGTVSETSSQETPTSDTPDIDSSGSLVMFGCSKALYYPNQQPPLTSTPPTIVTVAPPASSLLFSLPLWSPELQEASGENHSSHSSGLQEASKNFQSSEPSNATEPQRQFSLSRIASLMPSSGFPELTSSSHLSALSPYISPPLGASILPYLEKDVGQLRPYPSDAPRAHCKEQGEYHSVIQTSESDAAYTLIDLAATASRTRTTQSPNEARP